MDNDVSELYWILNILLELSCLIRKATLVNCGNLKAIYLSGNNVKHQNIKHIKHIEMDVHFVTEKVSRGKGYVRHVPYIYHIRDDGLFIMYTKFSSNNKIYNNFISTRIAQLQHQNTILLKIIKLRGFHKSSVFNRKNKIKR